MERINAMKKVEAKKALNLMNETVESIRREEMERNGEEEWFPLSQ